MGPRFPPSAMRVVERLAACEAVERVRLFGSHARGDAGPTADVDLAVDAPTLTRAGWARLRADADESATLYPFDLVWTDGAPAALRARIDAEGVSIYEREGTPSAL
jgi:predicted nucleotidyltransferase